MARPWSLAAAFASGLLPGLLLYWTARPQPAPLVIEQRQASPVTSLPAARDTATAPSAVKPPEAAKSRPRAADADSLEALTRLQTEQHEAISKLAAAEKTASEVQAKLRELEPRLAALAEEQQTGRSQEGELKQKLDSAQHKLASLNTELRSRDTRLAELEQAQQRAQRQGTDQGQRLQRISELVAELEENTRRRESYLNAILGRYREATELFRAMSLRLDNPRDVATPLNNDLARIQTAIQHADEDLRQLRALSGQAARLQKEIAARK